MGVLNWSLSAARNALVDPLVRALDGASARDYPAMIRGVMSGVRAFSDDRGGALVSSGTGNSYAVQTLSGVTELRPGVTVGFWADRDNTDAPFLNVDGTGPKSLRAADGSVLGAGTIQQGHFYTATWDELFGTLPKWRLVGADGGAGTAGTLVKPDASGSLASRAAHNGEAPGFVYLAVSTTAAGPAWTLYIKQGTSGTDADWSVGLPLKSSPAQSTADAQAAADSATASAGTATDRAAVATSQAGVAVDRASVATAQATTATDRALVAAAQAATAMQGAAAATVGAQTATQQAQIASDQATLSTQNRIASASARDQAAAAATATAGDRVQTGIDRAAASDTVTASQASATAAQAAAADARQFAAAIGQQIYDFSFDSAPDPSNDWSVG